MSGPSDEPRVNEASDEESEEVCGAKESDFGSGKSVMLSGECIKRSERPGSDLEEDHGYKESG